MAQKSMHAFIIARHTYFHVAQNFVRNATSFRAVAMFLFNILNTKKKKTNTPEITFFKFACLISYSSLLR
jgi:hypothetical protein